MVDENSTDETGEDAVLARMKLSSTQEASGRRKLTPAARRALAEAEERRKAQAAETAALPKEVNGRDGPEPVRYGDWEKNGIISDF
ncbi:DUF1674 domain-containing protein [Jiella endophytica]|uniref:DUF1674 domain-containing protein n=2 Tax=Jiella endophytica TaxID=2558362 RepID=A0A4Y8RRR1_9HYPH|nr:DUF1674 domain-containing protein [Jiella endophytica]